MYEATVIAQTNQWLYNFAAFFINMFLVFPRFFLFIWYSPSFLSYSICFCMSFLSHLYCDNSLPVHSGCHTKEKLYNFCMSVFVNKPCQFSFLHFTFLPMTVSFSWTLKFGIFIHSFFFLSLSHFLYLVNYQVLQNILLFFLTRNSHFRSFLGSQGLIFNSSSFFLPLSNSIGPINTNWAPPVCLVQY